MKYYTQNDYTDLDSPNLSLVIATANLLQKFSRPIEPRALAKMMEEPDWWTLTGIDESIDTKEVSDSGDFPTTSDAIIKLKRTDENGNTVDHYCLSGDPMFHSIIDSLDGEIKNASLYHGPFGWCSYHIDPEYLLELDEPVVVSEPTPAPETTTKTYTVLEADTIWEIAKRTGNKPLELLAINALQAGDIKPGMVITLPKDIPPDNSDRVTSYEVYSKPRDMHIIKTGGAKKWAFGNIKTWENLHMVGLTYPENANLKIYGSANVPIGEDTAKYYMDSAGIGKYKTTGLVGATTGFNWQDLEDGHFYKPKIEPIVEVALPIVPEPLLPLPEMDEIVPEPPLLKHDFRTTFKPLNEDREPSVYMVDEDQTIYEHGTGRESTIIAGQRVNIIGTFLIEGNLYGRVGKDFEATIAKGHWWGIPMHTMTDEDIILLPLTLAERAALPRGYLTDKERVDVALSKMASKYVGTAHWITKKIKGTK